MPACCRSTRSSKTASAGRACASTTARSPLNSSSPSAPRRPQRSAPNKPTYSNAGVPQHVIQKLLGHASPRMTARYAQIHDHTNRDAFERYCAQRVNTAGEHLDYEPDALTADAEWVKHNLARIRDSLSNGYCGRPLQQNCPHTNACLTCPDFQ